MEEEKDLVCKHPPCTCAVASEVDYCGDPCRDAMDALRCPCNHAQCACETEPTAGSLEDAGGLMPLPA